MNMKDGIYLCVKEWRRTAGFYEYHGAVGSILTIVGDIAYMNDMAFSKEFIPEENYKGIEL